MFTSGLKFFWEISGRHDSDFPDFLEFSKVEFLPDFLAKNFPGYLVNYWKTV